MIRPAVEPCEGTLDQSEREEIPLDYPRVRLGHEEDERCQSGIEDEISRPELGCADAQFSGVLVLFRDAC